MKWIKCTERQPESDSLVFVRSIPIKEADNYVDFRGVFYIDSKYGWRDSFDGRNVSQYFIEKSEWLDETETE